MTPRWCALTICLLSACRRGPEGAACAGMTPVQGEDLVCAVPGFADRDYILHLPPGESGARPLPLVIAMHGAGGSKKGMNKITCEDGIETSPNCLSRVADRKGFALVIPDGTATSRLLPNSRSWNQGGGKNGTRCERACKAGIDDVRYISELITDVKRVIQVDEKRVFVTGFSNGAGMSHRLACEMSDRIAAIAPVGGVNQFASSAPCAPARAVPILQIHGKGDRCWPYLGGEGTCVEEQEGSGTYVSVPESTMGWVERLGCARTPIVDDLPDRASDGATARRESYRGCMGGAEVVVVSIEGAGHTWPGGEQYLSAGRIGGLTKDFSASEMAWAFFSTHPLP